MYTLVEKLPDCWNYFSRLSGFSDFSGKVKNTNITRYQTTNLLKTRFLFLACKKIEREDKSKFVTKFVGIIVAIIFM